ncbi:MAG: putative rane bound lytic murein transglycosylase [Parcubacteria group bacterium]|nr:putative rane bound lytic murein transglycosylase [Parcubacteria group bacterium]
MLHDPSLDLLQAAINSDPNPSQGLVDLALSDNSALMAETGPDGSIPDTTTGSDDPSAANSGGSISVYVVKDGDSLSEIAAKYGVTMNTILWANDIKDPKTIHAGTSLIILPVSGIEHTVTNGETLNGIATKYGANADDIASFNGLDSNATVTSGQKLIIPGGELSAGVTPTKSTSTTKSSTSSTKTTTKSSSSIKTGGSLADVQANPYRGGSGAPLNGYFGNPVPGAIVTQGIHGWNGIDLGAPSGTPIYAAAAGSVIVSKVGGYNGGYGSYVVIDHGNGTQTLYAHFSSIIVSVGQSVTKGEKLGGVGMTGDATGNHLHFEVRGARNPFADCTLMKACSPE